jgi:serine phosphatase RsbU (regulator of sigma subunit)
MQEDLEASTTFVTLFAARVDPASGDLTYVDAGHGLALVLDQEGRARTLRSTDLPLGTLPDDRWHEHRDRLEQGETLLLISDGVLDAFADVAAAITAAEQVAREALGIEQLVDRVCGLFVESLQPDDVTVVAVRRTAHAATGRGT